jgi:hypothetical protein
MIYLLTPLSVRLHLEKYLKNIYNKYKNKVCKFDNKTIKDSEQEKRMEVYNWKSYELKFEFSSLLKDMFQYYVENNNIYFLRKFFSEEQDPVLKHIKKMAENELKYKSPYKINKYIKNQLKYLTELYSTCSNKGLHYSGKSIVPLIAHPKFKDKYLKDFDFTLFNVMKL